MVFDPKTYRDNRSGIGMPADDPATDSTSSWTAVSLLKGIYALLTTGNAGGATAVKQDTGNTSLSSIDTKMTSLAGYVDGLEALEAAISGKLPATLGQKAMAASLAMTMASDQTPFPVSPGVTVIVAASSTIARPGDTTAYASGDLVANSVTAGSVAALQFTTAARISGGTGRVMGARIQKSTASATNAAFRLHLFDTIPTFTSAGDNSAISTVVQASAKGYIGYIDITAMTGFADAAWGTGAADNARGQLPFKAVAQILYGIVEARGAYTPGNAEVFTISLIVSQD